MAHIHGCDTLNPSSCISKTEEAPTSDLQACLSTVRRFRQPVMCDGDAPRVHATIVTRTMPAGPVVARRAVVTLRTQPHTKALLHAELSAEDGTMCCLPSVMRSGNVVVCTAATTMDAPAVSPPPQFPGMLLQCPIVYVFVDGAHVARSMPADLHSKLTLQYDAAPDVDGSDAEHEHGHAHEDEDGSQYCGDEEEDAVAAAAAAEAAAAAAAADDSDNDEDHRLALRDGDQGIEDHQEDDFGSVEGMEDSGNEGSDGDEDALQPTVRLLRMSSVGDDAEDINGDEVSSGAEDEDEDDDGDGDGDDGDNGDDGGDNGKE